jgi:hypothetical protein
VGGKGEVSTCTWLWVYVSILTYMFAEVLCCVLCAAFVCAAFVCAAFVCLD